MNKSAAELKRKDRARKREAGYILKQIWVKPENWPKIKKYLDKQKRVRYATQPRMKIAK